jgi:phosphoribosylanthranilate isomerase
MSTSAEDEVRDTVTRIKICGITNRDDALAAVEYGADVLGFIFVPGTPRYVGQKPELDTILKALPPFVSRVGVCIDWTQSAFLRDTPIDTIQYYEEPPAEVANSSVESGELDASHERTAYPLYAGSKRMVRAFRVRDASSLEEIERVIAINRPHALLLDAYHPTMLGGAGQTFNWELAILAKERFGLPIILAGGLTPDNVGEAVRAVRPYAVDVSSGVESQPGRKDHVRLRAFIEAVHSLQ